MTTELIRERYDGVAARYDRSEAWMDAVNPSLVPTIGDNINRRTLENIRAAGLRLVDVRRLWAFGIFILVEATSQG